uniref:Rho GTPase activating protein 22 n=1 Tax=Oryzias sinensis TaxID=183150 RepID=A0A8C7YNZ2_9TELE
HSQGRPACSPAVNMVLGELSRLSRPCSPLEQEKALKAGWLRRQRSIMKNWQLRWFVLRTEALYFYKDQDESKAQGCIPLQGSQVNEVPSNQDDPVRHLFVIVPGSAGEKDRSGVGHESFLLMANSQSDMEEWVRAIRRAIWAPLGVFGQHLEETMTYEAQCGTPREVPVLVEQCACFIREHGLKEEGLFRAPGQTNHVRELQDAFDRGEKPVFDSSTDVHTVASLLKLYIRELPEPIIPFSKYTQFLSCAQLLNKDKEMGIAELRKQVKSLPQVNYNLIKYICKFLDEVQSYSNDNKMSVQNLATVFGPNILRARVEDPITMMEGWKAVLFCSKTILYHNLKKKKKHLRIIVLVPRRKLAGAATDDSLPSWKGSFKGSGASGGPKGKIGGSAGDVSAAGGSKWLMNGLSSLRAHRRTTSSGEKVKDAPASLKDSTLSLKDTPLSLKDTHRDPDDNFSQASLSHRILHPSHRLSAYDNVAPSSLRGSDKALTPDQNKERPTEASDGTDTLDDSIVIYNIFFPSLRLEESCSMYQSQINHLEEELDQEKKKYQMLEIRLRNSERAHRDAENRNVLLQQEMEEFFKTLGDLTTGATRTK